jgi:hypothetical protein
VTGPVVRGLCGQWEGVRRAHCDFAVTRKFLNGWRCALHAPGATENACPHGITWTEPCGACEALWDGLDPAAGPV